VATAVGDAAELLDVHGDQVTGGLVLIAAHLAPYGAYGGPCGGSRAGQTDAPVPRGGLVHRGGVHAQVGSDAGRAPAARHPPPHHPPLGAARGLVGTTSRSAGAVDHPRLALGTVAVSPASGCGD